MHFALQSCTRFCDFRDVVLVCVALDLHMFASKGLVRRHELKGLFSGKGLCRLVCVCSKKNHGSTFRELESGRFGGSSFASDQCIR